VISWLFLAAALVGAWFTLNAFWPTRRWQFLMLSFFAGWITGELVLWHLAWQAVAIVIFIWLGALDAWPGWLGLAITFVSWIGLGTIVVVSSRSQATVERALQEGLGEHYRDEIAPGQARRMATGIVRRQLALPLLLRDRRVDRIKNLRYAEGAGRRRMLDIWRPKRPVERAPVLLQIHGGGWVVGDKSQQALPLMLHLAAEGWVCVAANYRLSPRAVFPDHLVDCKLALKWIREHIAEYGGDPDYVVVTGGSAGGHLAMLLALTANEDRLQPGFEDVDTSVRACVSMYGPTDLIDVFRFEQGFSKVPRTRYTRMVMGTTPEDDPDLWRNASPIAHLRSDAPPFFVAHGTADNLVPVRQARTFVKELRAISTEPVCYAEIEGASHAFDVFHSVRTGNVVNGIDRFLAWLLSRDRHAFALDDDESPAGGDSASSDPKTTARTAP